MKTLRPIICQQNARLVVFGFVWFIFFCAVHLLVAFADDLPVQENLEYARILVNDHNCDQAMPILENILTADPSVYEAYLGRAVCYFERSAYGPALRDYFKALKLRPQETGLYKSIATIYLRQKNAWQAEEYIKMYLRDHPDDGEAWYSLAFLKLKTEYLDKALTLGMKDTLNVRQQILIKKEKDNAVMDHGRFGGLKGWLFMAVIVLFYFAKIWFFPPPSRHLNEAEVRTLARSARDFVVLIMMGTFLFIALFAIFVRMMTFELFMGFFAVGAIIAGLISGTFWIPVLKARPIRSRRGDASRRENSTQCNQSSSPRMTVGYVLKALAVFGLLAVFGFYCFCLWYAWVGFFSDYALFYILPSVLVMGVTLPVVFFLFKMVSPGINRILAAVLFLLAAFFLVIIGNITGADRYVQSRWHYASGIKGYTFEEYWQREQCYDKIADDPRMKDPNYFDRHRYDCEIK